MSGLRYKKYFLGVILDNAEKYIQYLEFNCQVVKKVVVLTLLLSPHIFVTI